MKILHLVANFSPEWGGPVRVVYGLTEALAKKEIKVFIFGPIKKGNDKNILYPKETTVRLFSQDFLYRLWTGHSFSLKKALRAEIEKFDLIHIHEIWHYPQFVASRLAKRYNKPCIITIHGELEPWCLNHKALKKKIYSSLIQKKILKEASALQALTKEEVKNISRFVDNKNIFLIPNGINLENFKNIPPREKFEDLYPELKGKKVILFLGRIHPKKGLDILAKTFSIISEYRKNVRLVIAGPDENGYESKIKSILKNEGVLDKVIFTGMLTGNNKLAALGRATMFVLSSYSEGFSMAVLEAMTCGLPVVITKQCNFPEIEKNKAGIIIEPDINQLVRAFNYLLSNPKLCKEMGENGTRLVKERFTWDKIADQMLNLYEKII